MPRRGGRRAGGHRHRAGGHRRHGHGIGHHGIRHHHHGIGHHGIGHHGIGHHGIGHHGIGHHHHGIGRRRVGLFGTFCVATLVAVSFASRSPIYFLGGRPLFRFRWGFGRRRRATASTGIVLGAAAVAG